MELGVFLFLLFLLYHPQTCVGFSVPLSLFRLPLSFHFFLSLSASSRGRVATSGRAWRCLIIL